MFLDTSSLNFILEYGEYIFDAVFPPTTLSKRIINDIKAFYNIFLTGKIHITQPWYQISEWYWCSGLKEYTSLYLRKGRSIKIYGYVHHVVDAKDRMPCLVSKPLTPPDPWEPLWS